MGTPMPQKRPNFFIVGAPKCGTTALYDCVRRHPEVFMPYSEDKEVTWLHKEPNHFCSDLGIADWLRVETDDDYLKLFEDATTESRLGSASPFNLMSNEAAGRIHEFTGGSAKIIIMLRSPVRWMRSFHHDMLRYGYEDIADFGKALDAESDRSEGRRLPKRAAFAGCLRYREEADFAPQVQRYFDLFGREQVLVGTMDEFQNEPATFLNTVLNFLEVDASLCPENRRSNDSATLLGTHFFDLAVGRAIDRLPAAQALKSCFSGRPKALYHKLTSKVLRPVSDKTIEPKLAAALHEEFRQPTADLAELLDRELPWSA